MLERLDPFVERLRNALGDELVSVVLYGSAAVGDYKDKVSDLNLLCVLRTVDLTRLEQAHQPVEWWLKQGQPPPVFLSVEEVRNARDTFAIEFVDITHGYKLLFGEDLVADIRVEPTHHRYQVEHELRSALLRLRERYLALQNDRKQVLALMRDSAPTFATLFRHALILAGEPVRMRKREAFEAAAQRFGLDVAPFQTLLDVREGARRLNDNELRPVFEKYLAEITRAAEAVDRLHPAAGRNEEESR